MKINDYKFIILFTIGISVVFVSCKDFKNPDLIPAYILIDTIEKKVLPGQGTNSHQIEEVYYYLNEEYLGAISPDKPFPVLAEGKHQLTFFPGIRENAIQDYLGICPLYERYEMEINLEQGKTITLTPQFRYLPSAQFVFVEEFESTHIFTDKLIGPEDGKLDIQQEEVFEGTGSGRMRVTKDNPLLILGTNDIYYDLPKTGAAIFLELNYLTETYFSIGIRGFDALTPTGEDYFKIILNPNKEWNKVYIRFNEEILALRKNGYQFIIRADYNFADDQPYQDIYIDNLKLIHL